MNLEDSNSVRTTSCKLRKFITWNIILGDSIYVNRSILDKTMDSCSNFLLFPKIWRELLVNVQNFHSNWENHGWGPENYTLDRRTVGGEVYVGQKCWESKSVRLDNANITEFKIVLEL